MNEIKKYENPSQRWSLITYTGSFLVIAAVITFTLINFTGVYELSEERIRPISAEAEKTEAILDQLKERELLNKSYSNQIWLANELDDAVEAAGNELKVRYERDPSVPTVEEWSFRIEDWERLNLVLMMLKNSLTGSPVEHSFWWLFGSLGLATLGGLMIFLPELKKPAGIKHNHIYHSSMKARGLIGWITGIYLIIFYIILYWYPQYMVPYSAVFSPISNILSGHSADRWFVYGTLYTMAILVMGVRMFIKYRHSAYHKIRTASVMFFQLAFAFLIPQLLIVLNQPSVDLKNIWPLNYNLFYDYQINEFISAGTVGTIMLIWGILCVVIGVPVLTYFYGKRWYCSWVCGCGGLAETLGDPYRQLSDKGMQAWQIERWLVHGVLVFVTVMTLLVLYTYFTGSGLYVELPRWIPVILILGTGIFIYFTHRKLWPDIPRNRVMRITGVIGGILLTLLLYPWISDWNTGIDFNSYEVREFYGFLIGAAFAGVIGVGFYPLMGNRVWCRFGCPLAAYLGIVQRFKSRFRITTNGGQCISCGNCSTYCEMGIDVKWYAQRGQDVVRASCVGCGVCASVCPRGVLRLENGDDTGDRATKQRTIHIPMEDIGML